MRMSCAAAGVEQQQHLITARRVGEARERRHFLPQTRYLGRGDVAGEG